MRALLLGLLILLAAAPASARWYAVDGDTLADEDTRERIRLENVDTPEMHGQCWREVDLARRAKAFTARALTFEHRVDRIGRRDKYGRALVRVFVVPFNADLGQMLVDAGLGREYHGGRRRGWCE